MLIALAAVLIATQAGPTRVIDGDTLDVAGARIRLYGIDAPETDQTCDRDGQAWACGAAATEALGAWLQGRTVTCVEIERDRYNRAVATCQADGQDVGAWMVTAGWAIEFRRYSDGRYAALEQQARASAVGIHAATFADPAAWRAGERGSPAPVTVDPACRIKGNIGSSGARIYHVPGSPAYAGTVIDPASGERWFCTEDEARAAGWRAPRG